MTVALVFLASTIVLFLGFRTRPHWAIFVLFCVNYLHLDYIINTPLTLPWIVLKTLGLSIALIVLWRWLVDLEPPPRIWRTTAILFGYGLLLAASLIYARNTDRSAVDIELYFRYISLGLIAVLLMRDVATFRFAIWGIMVGATFFGTLGAYIFLTGSFDVTLGGREQVIVSHIDDGYTYFRYESYIEANDLATLLVFVVPMAIERCMNEPRPVARIAAAFTVAACLIGIFFTASRGGWVALTAVALLALALRPKGIRVALAPLVVLLIVVAVPAEYLGRAMSVGSLVGLTEEAPDGSMVERMNALKIAWELILDNPILGVGVNNYEWYFREYTSFLGIADRRVDMAAHNVYAEVAAEQGLVGLVAFLGMLGFAGVNLVRVQRSLRADNRVVDADLIFAFALGCLGYLIGLLFLSFRSRFFWLVLTVALAVPVLAAAGTRQDRSWGRSFGWWSARRQASRDALARSGRGVRIRRAPAHAELPVAAERPGSPHAARAGCTWSAGAPDDGPIAIVAGARCSGVRSVARRIDLLDPAASPRCMVASEEADVRRLLGTFPKARLLWVYASYRRAALLNLRRFGAQGCLDELAWRARQHQASEGRVAQRILALSDRALRDGHALEAAALSWHIKTSEYFRLRLHEEPRVVLVADDAFVADPAGATARLCACLNLPCVHPTVSEGSNDEIRKQATEAFDGGTISTDVSAVCDDLWSALERRTEGGGDPDRVLL